MANFRLAACVFALVSGMGISQPAQAQFSPFADFHRFLYCQMGKSDGTQWFAAYDAPQRLFTDVFVNDSSLKRYSGEHGSFAPFWQDMRNALAQAGYDSNYALECRGFTSREEAERDMTAKRSEFAGRNVDIVDIGWPVGSRSALSTGIERTTLHYRAVAHGNTQNFGYTNARIDVIHRFLVCAGEIHFAYSLDRKSLHHSGNYVMPSATGDNDIIAPDSEPPVPLTFPLDATIEKTSFPITTIAHVQDAVAGEALGMGCFTGQSKKIGTVAELVGPGAKPEQVKTFLETLRIRHIADIPSALTHPQPVNPAVRAEREARERAEREARAAARTAELRTRAEALYRESMAKGGGGSVAVDPELYPILQQVIAENTARQNAEYQAQLAAAENARRASDARHEAEMARWRAEKAEADRKQAEWQAEVCRIKPSDCPAN